MVTNLEKTGKKKWETEFHQIMNFLTRSSIYYTLTVSPIVSTSFIEQFWTTAKSRTVNNTSYIDATVAGKPVTISEASIRSDLLFDDADEMDSLTNQTIFDNIQLIGSKSTSWDQILTNIATVGKNYAGKVTPLFDSMLVQQTEDEGDASERPSDSPPIPSPHHLSEDQPQIEPDPSPRPSPTTHISDFLFQRRLRSAKMRGRNEGNQQGNEGTDQQDGVTQTAPTPTPTTPTPITPTPTVFGDDETIAQVLIIMSQNKEKLKEKEKGVEIRNVEETERPRPTSTRSILTLRPLPKIDPKDKGKKRIKEEDESDTESEGITEAEKKFKQLANDEEVARNVQEEWEAKEEKKMLAEEEATKASLSNEYDFIQARLNDDKILAEKLQ
ncbi:hypothetical protein Tco_0707136 [Tanacetum coccineum]|uniref:Xylulose kinase-1 n=1 Tax=Tanacetum coccineum TaxID=301880 RepID=A0ABQ4Y9G3_9ASTR